jgi:hypothetical protein
MTSKPVIPTRLARRDVEAHRLCVRHAPRVHPRSRDGSTGPCPRQECPLRNALDLAAFRKAVVDWSGNCGNLTAAVGPFAIAQGLVDAPRDGIAIVRIWQANIGAKIIARSRRLLD